MNDLWKDLEHFDPNQFTRDDYAWIMSLACESLSKRHGDVEPHFAFLRREEIITEKKNGQTTHTVNIPRLTACYIRPSAPSPIKGKTAVGFAFCSQSDNPNKWYGRALAFKRAVLALVERNSTEENAIRPTHLFADFLRELGLEKNVKSFVADAPDYTVRKELATTNGKGEGS